MLRSIFTVMAVLACSATLAFADAKDDIQAAAQKLAGSDNYSWTTTSVSGFGTISTEGKTQKDGLTSLTSTFNDNTNTILVKDGKVVVKTDDGWKTPEEMAAADNGGGGGGPNPGMFAARMARNFKAPGSQANDWLNQLQNLKAGDAGSYTADFTEAAVKQQLTFGGRRRNADANAPAPEISNAKGTVTFWLKDGALSKMETHVSGTVSFNGNDRDIDRTNTVEIKDVGSTTIDAPADAVAKLNAPASQPAAQ